MPTKVALYLRVSTSNEKHGQTTENQLPELTSYCDRMGYEVVKVYEDEISGAKTREKRPAYNELCKDAFLKKYFFNTLFYNGFYFIFGAFNLF